jgi:hypothetical protein
MIGLMPRLSACHMTLLAGADSQADIRRHDSPSSGRMRPLGLTSQLGWTITDCCPEAAAAQL